MTQADLDQRTYDRIISALCVASHEMGCWVSPSNVTSQSRLNKYTRVRHIAAYILCEVFGMHNDRAAALICRERTSAIHAVKTVRQVVPIDPIYGNLYHRTMALLGIQHDAIVPCLDIPIILNRNDRIRTCDEPIRTDAKTYRMPRKWLDEVLAPWVRPKKEKPVRFVQPEETTIKPVMWSAEEKEELRRWRRDTRGQIECYDTKSGKTGYRKPSEKGVKALRR